MNEHVLRGQFASHLVLGDQDWVVTIVRLEKMDTWYQVEARGPDGNTIRFEMTKTPVGKWIYHADSGLPAVIDAHLHIIGKLILGSEKNCEDI